MTFKDLVENITSLGDPIVAVLMGLAIIVFLWGVMKYFTSFDSPDSRTKARTFMVWGIVGIAVMVLMWALVSVAGFVFGIDFTGIPQL